MCGNSWDKGRLVIFVSGFMKNFRFDTILQHYSYEPQELEWYNCACGYIGMYVTFIYKIWSFFECYVFVCLFFVCFCFVFNDIHQIFVLSMTILYKTQLDPSKISTAYIQKPMYEEIYYCSLYFLNDIMYHTKYIILSGGCRKLLKIWLNFRSG